MEKILITALLSILPLVNVSHPHEGDPFTTFVQEILVDLGFLEATSGIYDQESQNAVKIFQEKAGLVVDGIVGKNTLSKLRLRESAYIVSPDTTLQQITTTTNSSGLDIEPPVWNVDSPPYPSNIGTLFNLNMPAVTDNVGIVSYDIYVNGTLSTYASISDTKLLVTPKYDMTCANQIIYVIAFDAAGNSSQSPAFTIPKSNLCLDIGSSGGGGQSRLGSASSTGFLVTFGLNGLDTDAAGVAIDSSDNIYITGTSQGANLFGKNVTSGTTDDIFVAKLNSSGVVQWVYTAGGTGRDRGRKIALDSAGNIYVTGYYWSTVDFGGGNVTSNGNWDAFLLKLNSSGTFQWVKSYGSNSGNDLGRDVAIDSNDNIYMLGNYRGTVDFGGGNESVTGDSPGNPDIFLVKFNSSGVFQWVYTAGGSGQDDSRALSLDSSGNPYITGSFRDTVNFGGGNITAANTDDLFILKLNSSGAYQNIYTSNISTAQKGKGISVDSSGNIYATGTFTGTVDFGGGNVTTSEMDIYLLKLNSSFTFQWVKRFAVDNGSAGLALGLAATVDEDGNIYSVGQIGNTYNLGGASVIGGDQNDAYIVKYDSSGSFQWSKTFGSGSLNNIDKAQDIVIDSNGFVIAVGEVEGNNPDFTSVGDEVLTNFGSTDNPNFVLKIKSATGLIDQ